MGAKRSPFPRGLRHHPELQRLGEVIGVQPILAGEIGNGNLYTTELMTPAKLTVDVNGKPFTGISRVTSYYANNTSSNNWFGMELSYDYGFDHNQTNGNIAGMKWRSASQLV